MNQEIYFAALVTHIVGLTLMAGATFIDFIYFRQFWKNLSLDKSKSLILENILNTLQRYMGIGMLIIILSGLTMMYYLHEVWGQQMWFRVKMVLLLLIIINGLGIRRRLGLKLRTLLLQPSLENGYNNLIKLKANVTTVHVIQLFLFLIIFTLSVFKFN